MLVRTSINEKSVDFRYETIVFAHEDPKAMNQSLVVNQCVCGIASAHFVSQSKEIVLIQERVAELRSNSN